MGVTKTAEAISSCSACESRSAAIQAGVAVRSATTSTSVGPASLSIATSPKTQPLGGRHVDVSGTHDLVHPGHALRAVGQRGHRVGTAHLEDAVHARDARGHQHLGRDRAVLSRRRRHADLRHLDHRGRHRIHDDGGRIERLAARHVDPHPLERTHPVPEVASALLAHLPARGDALAVEFAHAHGGLAERGAVGRVHRIDARFPLLAGHLELVELRTVVLAHAGEQLLVAALAHLLDDPADVLLDVLGPLLATPLELREGRLEAGVTGLEDGKDSLRCGSARHA